MHWPPDHPALIDDALARWRCGAEELCPDGTAVRLLRYLPGRRAATLVEHSGGRAVLKMFASPRARGNHRRLAAFTAAGAADLVPRPLDVDQSGHVGLVEFVPGTPLDQVADNHLPRLAREAGSALRQLHDSSTELDRNWSTAEEAAQLTRTAGPETRVAVENAIARWAPGTDTQVPSHRDCYPDQTIAQEAAVRFIDLDDAAMAPRGLDVGNFLAHLLKDRVLSRRRPELIADAADALLAGYGGRPNHLESWTRLSLTRLAALAETRHHDLQQMGLLLDAAFELPANAVTRACPAHAESWAHEH